MSLSPQKLKARMATGLLSFPVTHFDQDLKFAPKAYQDHVSWLASYDAATLFAAGGTGEYFSLGQDEFPAIIRAAVEAADGRCPVVAGCGVNTTRAIADARAAEAAGADGLLLLPTYLMSGTQEGQMAHVKAVCQSVSIGVVVYNRATSVLTADSRRMSCLPPPTMLPGSVPILRPSSISCPNWRSGSMPPCDPETGW